MLRSFRRTTTYLTTLAVVLVAHLAPFPSTAAEEQMFDAFSTWKGQGVMYETGEDLGTFVGTIVGPLFIDTDKGPVSAGRIICPMLLDINLQNAKQVGRGKCTVTADDGARTFADWTCQGVHMVGCDGVMTLTGGTGRLAGVAGSGELRVRSTVRSAAAGGSAENAVVEFAGGILVLRNMKVKLPAQ